eukprot:506979-Prymnesium_polylepis.1
MYLAHHLSSDSADTRQSADRQCPTVPDNARQSRQSRQPGLNEDQVLYTSVRNVQNDQPNAASGRRALSPATSANARRATASMVKVMFIVFFAAASARVGGVHPLGSDV